MNKRQRKKRFKKIYGMSPEKYERWIREHWAEITAKAIKEAAEIVSEGFIEWGKAAAEAMKIFSKEMAEWRKMLQEAAVKGGREIGKDGDDPQNVGNGVPDRICGADSHDIDSLLYRSTESSDRKEMMRE